MTRPRTSSAGENPAPLRPALQAAATTRQDTPVRRYDGEAPGKHFGEPLRRRPGGPGRFAFRVPVSGGYADNEGDLIRWGRAAKAYVRWPGSRRKLDPKFRRFPD
jgi:hypothetical protein